MAKLSVIIPSRNEMFLARTIENCLTSMKGDTEVIAILDGAWANPPVVDDPRVRLIHHSVAIGQRAATNEGVRLSSAEYVMKLDAHCILSEGFDIGLMDIISKAGTNVAVVPRQYNLHAFNWRCKKCGVETYQGPTPVVCGEQHNDGKPVKGCGGKEFEQVIVWKPRWSRRTEAWRFDHNLHFQYWPEYSSRKEFASDLIETMSFIGACWAMRKDQWEAIDGLDESHGSWGQMGTEIACKQWLSGAKLLTYKHVWYSHLFRTQGGDFSFPYPNPGVERARARSKDLWLNNAWPKQKHPLSWLISKFKPIVDWHDPAGAEVLKQVEAAGKAFYARPSVVPSADKKISALDGETGRSRAPLKSLVYYTDSRLPDRILKPATAQLNLCCNGHELITVSLKPFALGKNITLARVRGYETMFQQILAGLEAAKGKYVFLCEHDILYHPSHFDFIPPRDDVFYYNRNTWKLDVNTGRALFYLCDQTSGLCADRILLIDHYKKRLQAVADAGGYSRNMGFEPGTNRWALSVDPHGSAHWLSPSPNIDLRHEGNLTRTRWSQDEFRNKSTCQGWKFSDEIPGWGKALEIIKRFV